MRKSHFLIASSLFGLLVLLPLGATFWATVYPDGIGAKPSEEELGNLASQCHTVVQRIEEFELANGRLPMLLDEIGFADSPWRYDLNETAADFELYRTHSHWVSSFNAFLYASSGTPRSLWQDLRAIEYGPYHYFVGAQHVKVNW
ncbi:MAG: hypothetical protein ACIAQF_04805 [Phycisphaerales bacterium JB065]